MATGGGEASKDGNATPRLAGEAKASPRLRLIANGSLAVNAVRSTRDASIRLTGEAEAPVLSEESRSAAAPDTETLRDARGRLEVLAGGFQAHVFVRLRSATARLPEDLRRILRRDAGDRATAADEDVQRPEGEEGIARREDVVSACLTLDELSRVLASPAVAGVESSERITFHQPIRTDTGSRSDAELEALARRQRESARAAWPDHAHRRRPRVLVGIVDVGGFDFAHPDFWRSESTRRTRFLRIWDQRGRLRDAPAGFGYGSEIRHEHMLRAVEDAKRTGLAATEIEPQSLMMVESHATHVASIAAGRSGVCPHAEIVGVGIHLPAEDEDRRRSFYDSTRIADAVEYLLRVRREREEELGLDPGELPLAVNISLGTNGHAHDGSSGTNRWLDHVLSEPGRAICVAAGNAGQEGPVEPGDLGFMLGRIHTSGRIPSEGLTRDLHWVVPGDGEGDFSENELEVWYEPQDRIAVSLRTPDGTWLPEVEPGEFIENRMLDEGTFVSIYSDRFVPANGANRIAVYLSPFFSATHPVGVAAGLWTVRLRGVEIRDGGYHGWIERDDPRPLGRAGRRELWALPSFFSATTNVDESSVSSLACGHDVLAVANLDAERFSVNVTSSQGPTRDGRQKPEVCAPGTDIVAASGFDAGKAWVAMSGTSMASPYVCGIVAQMLAHDPGLTAPQIRGILRRCARPLPGADFAWRNDAGFGPPALERIRDEVESLGRLVDKFPRED